MKYVFYVTLPFTEFRRMIDYAFGLLCDIMKVVNKMSHGH